MNENVGYVIDENMLDLSTKISNMEMKAENVKIAIESANIIMNAISYNIQCGKSRNSFRLYTAEEFGELKVLDELLKNTRLGIVYAIEFGDKIKIGCTKSPYSRFITFRRETRYAGIEIGDVLISIPHTNYRYNEKVFHEYYKEQRIEGTELFNLMLGDFDLYFEWEVIETMQFRNDTVKMLQDEEKGVEALKDVMLHMIDLHSQPKE